MSSIEISNKGSCFYCAKDFTGPSFYLMYDGEKAFYQYEKINKDCIESDLGNSKVFFDIGANIGLFSLYFKLKYPGLIVHAFEPEGLNYTSLKSSINSFSMTDFYLNRLGLSDSIGAASLHIDKLNMGGASVSLSGPDRVSVDINLSTLDQYCSDMHVENIDVIKIDVEGLEEKIIIGGLNSIRKFKPVIIFECMHDELVQNNVVAALRKLNLSFTIEQVKTKVMVDLDGFEDFAKNESQNGLIGTEYVIRFK
tara:strand:+ start:6890 stop:7648 length:759 start_codon:yes stop_codon:yes gene_type:complete